MSLGGMSMMPGPDGGGGGRPKRPSGEVHPAVSSSAAEDGNPTAVIRPMPVVLTVGTIIKLASVIMVPLLGAVSVGILHYHRTNTHMDSTLIHLGNGERPTLETHVEAEKSRAKLEKSIKREVKLQAREIKQDVASEQKVQIKKLGAELKLDQKDWGDRLLREMRHARRDIRNQ